jgi:hypothetical protein
MGFRIGRKGASHTSPISRGLAVGPGGGPIGPTSLDQAVWHINALTGSDSNTGLTAGTALRTHAEFERRIGHWNTLTAPVIDVFIDSDLPATDPINLILVMRAGGQQINYHGSRTTTRSGTITGLTTLNRATNTPWAITDGAVDWTPDVGSRGRLVASGALFWVARATAPGTARISNPATFPQFAANAEQLDVTPVTPVLGEAYVIESLRRAYYGCVAVNSQNNDTGAGVSTVQFLDFDWQKPANSAVDAQMVPNTISGIFSPTVIYNGCKFNPDMGLLFGQIFTMICHYAGLIGFGGSAQVELEACLAFGQIIVHRSGANCFIDYDFLLQGARLTIRGTAWPRIGTLGVFDSPSDGIRCQQGATLNNKNSESGTNQLYGSGNAGFGYNGQSGSQLFYDASAPVPSITGTSGDFTLGGLVTFQSYDVGTGSYNPSQPSTWANLAAATDGHAPAFNAHIVQG